MCQSRPSPARADGPSADLRLRTRLIVGRARASDWKGALRVFEELRHFRLAPDLVAHGAAVGAYERGLQWDCALQLLRALPATSLEPDVALCNAASNTCERASRWQAPLLLLSELPGRRLRPDVVTCGTSLAAHGSGLAWEGAAALLAGPCERLRKEAVSTRILVAEADEKAPGKGRTAHVICGTGPGGNSDHQEGSSTVIIEIAACILDALDSGDRDALVPGFATPAYHLAHLGIVERLAARGFLFKFFDGAPARELFQNFLASAGALAAS